MPEYLAPGVYVEEVAFESTPIEGVSTSTQAYFGVEMMAIVHRMTEGENEHWHSRFACESGMALLELVAWLTDKLARRSGEIPGAALPHAARVAGAALSLLADREAPESCVLKRTRFLAKHRIDDQGRIIEPDRSA